MNPTDRKILIADRADHYAEQGFTPEQIEDNAKEAARKILADNGMKAAFICENEIQALAAECECVRQGHRRENAGEQDRENAGEPIQRRNPMKPTIKNPLRYTADLPALVAEYETLISDEIVISESIKVAATKKTWSGWAMNMMNLTKQRNGISVLPICRRFFSGDEIHAKETPFTPAKVEKEFQKF